MDFGNVRKQGNGDDIPTNVSVTIDNSLLYEAVPQWFGSAKCLHFRLFLESSTTNDAYFSVPFVPLQTKQRYITPIMQHSFLPVLPIMHPQFFANAVPRIINITNNPAFFYMLLKIYSFSIPIAHKPSNSFSSNHEPFLNNNP